MKMSCLSVTLFPAIINGEMTIKEYAQLCKELELDAFDLGLVQLKNHTPKYIAQVKADIAEVGMQIAMITTYPDFTHPDANEREQQLEQFEKDLKTAALVGAKIVRATAGQAHPETGRNEGIRWAVEGLKKSVDAANQCNIQLVYENHGKPGAWQYSDFSHPTDIFLEIAESIADTPIKILFDTANPIAYGDDALKLLNRVLDRVLTLHVADTDTVGLLNPVLIGTGLSPIKKVFGKLKASGFDGWISIEEASGKGKEGIRHATEYVRKTWKAV